MCHWVERFFFFFRFEREGEGGASKEADAEEGALSVSSRQNFKKKEEEETLTLSPAVHVPPWNSTAIAGGGGRFPPSSLSPRGGSQRSATCLSLGPYLTPSTSLPSFFARLLSDRARSAKGIRTTWPVSSSAMSLACLAAVERRAGKSGQSRSSAFWGF